MQRMDIHDRAIVHLQLQELKDVYCDRLFYNTSAIYNHLDSVFKNCPPKLQEAVNMVYITGPFAHLPVGMKLVDLPAFPLKSWWVQPILHSPQYSSTIAYVAPRYLNSLQFTTELIGVDALAGKSKQIYLKSCT